MPNTFLNDHKTRMVEVSKILKITAGDSHCWCDSNVGMIRKPNNAIPDFLWGSFLEKKPKIEPQTIVQKEMTYKLKAEKLKWWQTLWNWIKGFFLKI
jgi:hypothetical protein